MPEPWGPARVHFHSVKMLEYKSNTTGRDVSLATCDCGWWYQCEAKPRLLVHQIVRCEEHIGGNGVIEHMGEVPPPAMPPGIERRG